MYPSFINPDVDLVGFDLAKQNCTEPGCRYLWKTTND